MTWVSTSYTLNPFLIRCLLFRANEVARDLLGASLRLAARVGRQRRWRHHDQRVQRRACSKSNKSSSVFAWRSRAVRCGRSQVVLQALRAQPFSFLEYDGPDDILSHRPRSTTHADDVTITMAPAACSRSATPSTKM